MFFVICFVCASVGCPHFLTTTNIVNIVKQNSHLVIVATAMTFVVTTGGIDLSVGSTAALVGLVAAIELHDGMQWMLVVLLMLGLGALIGLAQGRLVAYRRIPAFLVTLAGLGVLHGIALGLQAHRPTAISRDSPFLIIGQGSVLGLPWPGVLALLTVIVGWITFALTRYGRYVAAIGSNGEAVRRAGVDIRRVVSSTYVLSGVTAAIAGIVITARTGSGYSEHAVALELQVIAAVVLGGTSLSGGHGTLVGTAVGAMTIAVISNALMLIGAKPSSSEIVFGLLVLAVSWAKSGPFTRLGTNRFTQ
jgi:simple sugar transport system permease protein